ncbi:hypothetical protein [Leptospira licerasiae]|uniref:hypothetical protein n=1 Tax=Leptospira licerasiae TaxID=447106 RepID=UPI001083AF61|nr:hypothetical protein [Leptospira licerasiae]TGM88727.1 hypothetical protein EHR05_10980 [Leptospira licerasiae]
MRSLEGFKLSFPLQRRINTAFYMQKVIRDPLISARMSSASKDVRESVCPLFVLDRNIPLFTGNSVLIQLGIKRYLITAAHIFDRASLQNKEIIAPYDHPTNGPGFYGIRGVKVQIAPEKLDVYLRNWDIAVFSIHPSLHNAFKGKKFLNFDEIELKHNLSNKGEYFLIGTAGNKSKSKVQSKQVNLRIDSLFTYAADIEFYRKYQINSQWHMLYEYPKKVVNSSTPFEFQTPNIEGLSGSGIFFCKNLSTLNEPIQSSKLVGIIIDKITESKNTFHLLNAIRFDCILRILSYKSNYIRKRFFKGG